MRRRNKESQIGGKNIANKKCNSQSSSLPGGESRSFFPQLLADLKKDPNQFHNLQHSQRRGEKIAWEK